MITEEQILEIASSYLRELYSGDVGDVVCNLYEKMLF